MYESNLSSNKSFEDPASHEPPTNNHLKQNHTHLDDSCHFFCLWVMVPWGLLNLCKKSHSPSVVKSIQLLLHVDLLMRNEVGPLVETLPAHCTQKGLFARVNFLVSDAVVVTNEALAALRAGIWLLPSVDPLVFGEVPVAAEAFAAV